MGAGKMSSRASVSSRASSRVGLINKSE
jgi:hypothetical protein